MAQDRPRALATAQRQAAVAELKTIFAQDSADGAAAPCWQVADTLRGRFPELGELQDEARDDVLAYMTSGNRSLKTPRLTRLTPRTSAEPRVASALVVGFG